MTRRHGFLSVGFSEARARSGQRGLLGTAAPAPASGNQLPLLAVEGAFLIHFPSVKALAAQGAAFALFLALRFPGRAAGEAQHLTHS